METLPPGKTEPSVLDSLLNKYVGIWLWSIIFGATVTIGYSFRTYHYDRWGALAVVLVIPLVFALVSISLSWLNLYFALTEYLLPQFFATLPENVESARIHFARRLRSGFYFLICAIVSQAVAAILEQALSATSMR